MVDHVEDWVAYKTRNDLQARDRLVEVYAPLVERVASRVKSRLPPHIEQQDLSSYGAFGLIDAIEKFNPDLGYRFESYAVTRIRGAIIDELRQIDWVPRSIRSKQRRLETTTRDLEADLGRHPAETEIASRMGIPVSALRELQDQIHHTHIASYNEQLDPENEQSPGDSIPDSEPGVEDRLSSASTILAVRENLGDAISMAPEKERMVLTLYYKEGLTLSEVGTVLGVTESRICQIHTKAVDHITAGLVVSDLEPA